MEKIVCTIVTIELHGNGKLTRPHPLTHKLYPSPSVPSKQPFCPRLSPQHLTSVPIRYQNTVSIPVRTRKVYRNISQSGHSSGKPGKVRESKSGQGKVMENELLQLFSCRNCCSDSNR